LLDPKLEYLLAWADQLVVTQKLDAGTAESIRRSGLPVIDVAGSGMARAGAGMAV
jgi:hypothetical protein